MREGCIPQKETKIKNATITADSKEILELCWEREADFSLCFLLGIHSASVVANTCVSTGFHSEGKNCSSVPAERETFRFL